MPSPAAIGRRLDELSRDLDLVVYRLERAPPEERDAWVRQRRRLRRELEQLRDTLQDLARELEG